MKRDMKIFLSLLLASLFLSVLIFFVWSESDIVSLTKEDGVIENSGALFFLATSVVFFILFFKEKGGNDFIFLKFKKNIFYLLLGILFFIAFGEEISWGQRIFQIGTPEVLQKYNIQNEINIHNLKIFHGKNQEGNRKSFTELLYNIDRLFSLFWFSYCLIIPIIAKMSSRFSRFVTRINLPLVPIWIGVFFFFNYMFSKILERVFPAELLSSSITEVKETYFSFLFLMASLWFLSASNRKGM